MFKLMGKKISCEIFPRRRVISNINLKKTEKTRLELKFPQEIRTETRGIWSATFTFGGDIWWGYLGGGGGGGFIPYYIPEGGYVPYFFTRWENLFRSTDSSFYLLNQFDWPKMTYTEFTFRFHGIIFLFEIFFITRNHG